MLELEKYQIVAEDDSTKLVIPLMNSNTQRPVKPATANKAIETVRLLGSSVAKGEPFDLD